MNVTALIDTLKNAIHDDAALSTWCLAQYGQAQKVFVGIDTRKPPASSDYPLVHIFPLYKRAGGGTQEHSIGITCGIYDDDTLTVPGRTRVTELEGISALETFRKYVEDAVLGITLGSGYWVDSIEITYETIEYFPFFLASMEVRIAGELAFGSDQFE